MIDIFKNSEKLAQDYKELFKKDSITSVRLTYQCWFSEGWQWHATVEYHNGDLKGEKSFKAKDIGDIMEQIQAFIKSNES